MAVEAPNKLDPVDAAGVEPNLRHASMKVAFSQCISFACFEGMFLESEELLTLGKVMPS